MNRQFIALGLGALVLSAYGWGQDLSSRLFSPIFAPSGCHVIPGLFPVGDRTERIWQYTQYAVVMPPYKKKLSESLECGSQKGTLYFFEYATEAQKDHALLFAKPVLAKQHGVAHELPVREWSTGFVLVSFSDTPPALLAALTAHLTPNRAVSAPPPLASQEQTAVPIAKPAAAVTVSSAASPSSTSVVTKVKAPPTAIKKRAEDVNEAVIQSTSPAEPLAQLRPTISAQPFESSDPSASIQARRTGELQRSIPKSVVSAPTVKPVKTPEPRRERPHPVSVPLLPAAPAVAAPSIGAADLSSSVLESYASKMGCESADRNSQTQLVCSFMQQFASGLPPELPFSSDVFLIGPVYTIDANGRFTDLHYDALAGTRDADVVSFFSLPSAGGKDDFEIKQLVEARKAKTQTPLNEIAARLPALAAAKRFGLRKAARSIIIQPVSERRLFIRRAADHWVVIGVSGATPEAQQNTSLVVAVLY